MSFLEVDEIRRDATVCKYLSTGKLLYMFLASIAPITRNGRDGRRNMSSNLIVNKYLHTVASRRISST